MRASIPRFSEANRDANQVIVDHVRALAERRECSPGQIALAWLLAQSPTIVPIPGTRRLSRVEENAAATEVALSADEVHLLNHLADGGVQGERYGEQHLNLVNR